MRTAFTNVKTVLLTPHAERQRDDRDRREPAILDQEANGEAQILQQAHGMSRITASGRTMARGARPRGDPSASLPSDN
jgi:hypothetical protein